MFFYYFCSFRSHCWLCKEEMRFTLPIYKPSNTKYTEVRKKYQEQKNEDVKLFRGNPTIICSLNPDFY